MVISRLRMFIAEKISDRAYRTVFFVAVADMAAKGAAAILTILIARFLGPTLYGQYAAAAAVCGLAIMAADLGFDRELIRRAGRDPNSLGASLLMAWSAILLAGVLGLAFVGVVQLTARYDSQVNVLLWLMLPALIIAQCAIPMRAVSLVLHRPAANTYVQLVSTLTLTLLTAFALWREASLEVIVLLQGATALAVMLYWRAWLGRGFFAGAVVHAQPLSTFIKASLPFGVSNIIWIAYFNFATFLLSVFQTQTQVGMYAGVFRLVGINYVLGYALASSFTATLFKAQEPTEYRNEAKRLVSMAFTGAVLLCAGLFVTAPWLVSWTIGDEYTGGVAVVRVLSFAAFFRIMNYAYGEILATSGLQSLKNKLELGMLASNGAANLLLIPRFGAMGAGIAAVVAELVLFLLLVRTSPLRSRT